MDLAMRLRRSLGTPFLFMASRTFVWASSRLLMSGSAMSRAMRESRVTPLSRSPMVFSFFRKDSTMFVPAPPKPTRWMTPEYPMSDNYIPSISFNLSFISWSLSPRFLSVRAALIVRPSSSRI